MTPKYEHYWEPFEIPGRDGPQRFGYRSRTIRTDIQRFDYWTSIGIRARNRQAPPPPDGPERFYRQERFGPSDARVYHAHTTDKASSATD